jgi:hypothetical protein
MSFTPLSIPKQGMDTYYLPSDLVYVISQFLVRKPLKLLDWIDPGKIDWIDLGKIDWEWLSLNPSAIHLLEANMDKIDWAWLSENPGVMSWT